MTTATTTLKQALLVSMLCLAVLASSNRVLVLVDDLAQIDTFSIYFDSLRESGFDLKFALPDDPQTHLVDVGEFTCDKLIVFSPETDDFANFNKDKILSFIDRGNDVLIAASPDTASSVANLIADNGAIPLRDSTIIDHLNFDASDPEGDHSTIIAKDFTEFASSFLGADKINPILYRGTGLLVRDDNPLIAPILRASSTAYARSGHAKEIPAAGSKITLLASLQARNNARVTISGSLSLFSNQFITQKIDVDGKPTKTGNFDLATKITQWTFQQTKVLRLSNVKHHLVGQTEQQDTYTIREFVEYSFDVEQWDGKKWSPFNADDFQLEFQMIDPYVRSTLVNDGKGHHSTQFQVPDVYGIFTFKLTYSRPGYSYLQDRNNVIVRPLRHDQYERFIPIAFPYYAASFSMMLGVVLFSFIFLFTRN